MEISRKSIKILHLEDERTDAILINRLLKKKGLDFDIRVVDTKETYEKALAEFYPDVILADHSLPAFDSRTALEILKTTNIDIPFLLLTGAIDSEEAVDMLKNGASDFILKDRPERLASAIEKALEQSTLVKEKRNSEYQFKKLIESSEDVFCLVSREGKIKYISPSAGDLLGYESNHKQDTLFDLLKPHRPNLFNEALEKCSGTSSTIKRIFRVNNKTRNERWFHATFTNLLDDEIIQGIRIRLRDITKEKESEIKISQSEKKYRSLFENSLDGILLTGVNGDIYAANPAACAIYQMTEEEICQRGRNGLVDLTDPNLVEALEQRKKTGKVRAEIRMIRKDGSTFPTELTSSVVHSSKNEVAKTTMVFRDITEKKSFQKELEKTKERYKMLFQLNPLPVFLYNEDTEEIIDVNDRTCEHYGYSREDLIGKDLGKIYPPENIKYARINGFEKNKKKTKSNSTVHHLKKDGTIIDVKMNSQRLSIDGENYILAACNDVTLQNKTLVELQKLTKKLNQAERIAKLGYWEYIPESGQVYCSKQVYNIFGFKNSKDLLSLDHFVDKIHPDDRESFNNALNTSLSGNPGFEIEYRLVFDNEAIKWIRAKGKIIKDPSKKIIGLKGILQDITLQKNSIKEIVRSEARYKGLVQSQTSYFVRIGMDGNYSFCNNKFIKDYGWMFPGKDPIGHSSMTDIKKYHHEKVKAVALTCIKNPNESFQIEIHKKLLDGGVKPTLWEMIYLPEDHGGGEIQCNGIDISGRVETEKQNRFQASLLNKIGQGIMATNEEGEAIYWNRAAELMYGWKKEEILNKNILKLLYPNSDLYDKKILKLLKAGKTWSGETIAIRKDKTKFPIQITDSPLANEKDEFEGSVIISSDISSLKKSEIKLKKLNKNLSQYTQELVNANKGLEQFSYIVSHNLRAPAANIIGLAEVIKQGNQPEDVRKMLFQEIINNVDRLDMVIRDLNDILKVNSEINLTKEPVDIKEIIDNICYANKHLIEENEAEIILDLPEVKELRTVKSYFYSIIYNLISNSIKYRRPEVAPVINIKSREKKEQIIISIADNGLGINLSNKKDLIFGLYKRFHDHVDGKGMGLFMVKTQVKLLGGEISVDSKINQGTEFTLYFNKNLGIGETQISKQSNN